MKSKMAHSKSANSKHCTGNIPSNSASVQAWRWSLKRPFTIRRDNQNTTPNSITLSPEHTASHARISSPVAAINMEDIKKSIEKNAPRQKTDKSTSKCLKQTAISMGEELTAMTTVESSGTSLISFPDPSKPIVKFKKFQQKKPSKNWISRFHNMQNTTKPRKRSRCTETSNSRKLSLSGWGFASKSIEYQRLGIDLSYAEVTRADWKLRNLTPACFKMGSIRKPRPGSSSLRYCLSYSTQVPGAIYGSTYDHGQIKPWLSIGSTARAAVSCLGL
ncbi:hypothetical protein NHQ30_003726 [Ciborinia camelliae]|nr:hypothetical protein NHQ30_003726 [Ciborinia camelliae]